MKIFIAIGSGCIRSFKAWKGILITWFITLMLVSFVALPMKGIMKSGFGKSTITEKLVDGINVEVIRDLGPSLRSLISLFSSGMLLLMFSGIFINAFLAGGLFNCVKGSERTFSASEFFRASAKNFWSFLFISLIISIIILFLGILMIGLPLGIVAQMKSVSEKTQFLIGIISVSGFLLAILIFLLVADYARAWQVRNEKSACFKAIGFGFDRTFGKFLSSFLMMVMMFIVQVVFVWLVIKIVGEWKPVTGWGVFLLFLLSQFLFFVNAMLKTCSYGSVTSLMEMNDPVEHQENHVNLMT
jgi:MFS family permease